LPDPARPIRTGLIGRGLGGRAFHQPLLTALPEFDLAVIAGAADAAATAIAPDLELIVISTPNVTHHTLARAALQAGKHVVIDKPFTVTVEEADDLIQLARAVGRMLTVFHNRRWDGDFLTVRKLLAAGSLGTPLLVEAHWDRFRPAIKAGWREQVGPGTGLLNDLGPHMIDQALCLFGQPIAITADILNQRAEAQVDDYFDLRLDYAHGRVRLAASTLVADPRPRFAVHGTGGSYVKHGLDPQEAALRDGADPLGEEFGRDERDGILTLNDGPRPQPTERGCYADFYRAVAAAIREGAPPPVDPLDARAGLQLIALARESAAQGRTLPV
jgi:scyllo-inositol 2-dehydrogenase (NADP+)